MLGFTIYNTMDAWGCFGDGDCLKNFCIEYYLVIDDRKYEIVKLNISIEHAEANNKMKDIFLEKIISVKANQRIQIAVRYYFNSEDMITCDSWRGNHPT